MSLLMKALEKAAKDREDADGAREAAAPAGAAKSQFTLEPIIPPAELRTTPVSSPPPPPSPPPSPSSAKPATAPAPAAATRDSTLAAAVIRASGRDTGGGLGNAVAYLREHPLVVFGPIAALFLIGYGTYIYLQMTSPGMVARQAPRSASPRPPSAPTPASASGASTAAAPESPIPLTALGSPPPEGASRARPAGATAAAPIPASQPPASTQALATAVPAAAPAERDAIKVTAGGAAPVVNPLLSEAYAALNAGDLELAPQLYNQLLRSEPNNVDALLGLAAIATQQGDSEQASRHYLKVLQVEPRNALAQAGLIGMLGRADPLAAETRLKQLIAREPSAYLYFTLGNVYADQNRWPDAQQAYFQAHYLQSSNPDFAYNLAIGLEHVGQPKLALEYYQRALRLAAATSRANFSTAAVEERISALELTVR